MIYKIHISIQGMSCASCVKRVENAFLHTPGVLTARVHLGQEVAIVEVEDLSIKEKLIPTVEAAGYSAQFLDETKLQKFSFQGENDQIKRKLWVSLFFTVPLVLEMVFGIWGDFNFKFPPLLTLFCASIVQFYGGSHFYKSAYFALKQKASNMDLLVVLGTSAAYFFSVYQFLQNFHVLKLPSLVLKNHFYFESSAVVITLVLVGKYIEKKAKHKTSWDLNALQNLRPQMAHVQNSEGIFKDQSVEFVSVGSFIRILPGEKIPLDGKIFQGESEVHSSFLTGESKPQFVKIGDQIFAGSLNGTGTFLLKTTETDGNSTISKILNTVEAAQLSKAPIEKTVDLICAYFVPVVCIISLFTFFLWYFLGNGFSLALTNAICVLIISCPCALGLATPLSLIVGVGGAAKRGILIRDANVLEIAGRVNHVAFDKTGTLTKGEAQIREFFAIKTSDQYMQNDEAILGIAAGLQQGSEHLLAKATLQKAEDLKIKPLHATHQKAIPGMGISGQVDGKKFYFVNQRYLNQENILLPKKYFIDDRDTEKRDQTTSFLLEEDQSQSKQVLGVFFFSDHLKKNAEVAVSGLKELGLTTSLLTGDTKDVAALVAEQLKISEYHAELLPQEKMDLITAQKAKGLVVAMVGDGLNDAPALAVADVGITMGTAIGASQDVSGLTLLPNDPALVPVALQISKMTLDKIKQNLFFAFFYNIICIPAAAMGFLNPMIAGFAMAFSSVSVALNSLWLRKGIGGISASSSSTSK